MASSFKLTVHSADGSEHEYAPTTHEPITLGSVRGCTILIRSEVPFIFTLIHHDSRQDEFRLYLTDGMKGELFADGEARPLHAYIRDGSAEGVESLGVWSLVLPIPCSGYLSAAGVVIHFEIEAKEERKSDFRQVLPLTDHNPKTAAGHGRGIGR